VLCFKFALALRACKIIQSQSLDQHLVGVGVLDNITMYWLTKTGISSARLYWGNKYGFFDVKGVAVPVGVSAFPYEVYTAPLSWSQKAYPKLVYYKKHVVGGHFAAWEQPQLFCEDVRATFRLARPA
jgi:hypothetical protein